MKSVVVSVFYINVIISMMVISTKVPASLQDKPTENILKTQSEKASLSTSITLNSNTPDKIVLLAPLVKESMNTRVDNRFWTMINNPNHNLEISKSDFVGTKHLLLEDSQRKKSNCMLRGDGLLFSTGKIFCKAKPKIHLKDRLRPIYEFEKNVQLIDRKVERLIDSANITTEEVLPKVETVQPFQIVRDEKEIVRDEKEIVASNTLTIKSETELINPTLSNFTLSSKPESGSVEVTEIRSDTKLELNSTEEDELNSYQDLSLSLESSSEKGTQLDSITIEAPNMLSNEIEAQPQVETPESVSDVIVSKVAQQFECINGDATRIIDVEYLRRSEFVCRVKYEKDGTVSYPWEARFGREFCHSKAQELFQTLTETGIWECAEI